MQGHLRAKNKQANSLRCSTHHPRRIIILKNAELNLRSAARTILRQTHAEKAVTGYTDLYTKQEFDPWKEEIEESFDKYGIFWSLNSVQYEEETGFTHYEWYWSVV